MPDYSNLKLDPYLNRVNPKVQGTIPWRTALVDNIRQEPTPFLHRTVITKGTIAANLGGAKIGGRVDFKDTTGGTSIVTYNPNTGSITLNGLISFNSPLILNSGGSVQQGTLIFNTNASTAAVISMVNQGGTEKIRLEVGTGNFGTMTSNELDFISNLNNKLVETFGVTAQCADTVGVHAFRVTDNNAAEAFALRSNGQFRQGKVGYTELLGTMADPGGGASLTARLFVGTTGTASKANLRVEFPTGASIQIASEP